MTTSAPRQTSNLAIAALAFSCASVMLGPFGFVPGLILASKAKQEIIANPQLDGIGLAKAATVIGWSFVGLFAISIISAIWLLTRGPWVSTL